MTALSLPAYLAPLRDALVDARHGRIGVAAAGLPVPASDRDAYAVQDSVADVFGWFNAAAGPHAWKVGAASRAATPNAAPLPAPRVVESPATFPAGAFDRILIEGEIAFRLSGPIDGADDARAMSSIGAWLVTIEVIDPRYADWDSAQPTQKLADHGLHGALVIGSGTAMPPVVAWTSLVARVRRNGEIVRETRGGHPLGDLMFLVRWLARHAAGRGMPLGAGDVISAGTWTGVLEAFAGETIDVEFDGIGRASARFD